MHSGKELLEIFENYRNENPIGTHPHELYQPIRYIMDLGGKRMRPVMLLMAVDMFEGDIREALPVAQSIELFHNFTLMHDDIMDHASLRRGQPTVHEKFDENRAILSGDAMLIYVYEFLQKVPEDRFREVFKIFNKTAIEVCEGQQLDINFQQQDNVTIENYLQMIEYKTAVLMASSLKCGAVMAGADQENCDHVYEFGRNMGLYFQLMDDILDTFGSTEKFGKKIGGDIEENKKTWLLIKALELSEGKTEKELIFYLENNVPHDEKVKGIKQIFKELNIESLAREQVKYFHEKAMMHFERISVSNERKQELRNYANWLMDRQL